MKRKFLFGALAAALAFSLVACGDGGGGGNNGENQDNKDSSDVSPLRIVIKNNEFMVNGKRIWINGVNTPWDTWNDFGGTGTYNSSFWDSEFKRLRDAGINATRVWINCNGYGSIAIDADGTVTGVTTSRHWSDLDNFFALAEKHELYIMATLLSFDHFKIDGNRYGDRWRNLLTNKKAESFAKNYTIPFLQRYGDNPYLWSIDICNEPDWINEEEGFDWTLISYFLAVQAAAIHENSDVLVTVGMAYSKWNVDGNGNEGNKVSDSYLKSQYNNSNAYLDFWSPHYYDWVGEWYGVPHYLTPSGTLIKNGLPWTGGWGLDASKPALLGECAASGTGNKWGLTGKTIITDYESAFDNGWQGVMAWTSNDVDGNGDLSDLSPATKNMQAKYPQLIYP